MNGYFRPDPPTDSELTWNVVIPLMACYAGLFALIVGALWWMFS